jgi:hypothetical protein
MGYNKIVYDNNTLIDLTADTITPDKILVGYTAHDRAGNLITGTASGEVGQVRTMDELESNWDNEGGFLLSYDPATGDRTYILNTVTTSKGIFNESTSYTQWVKDYGKQNGMNADGTSNFIQNNRTIFVNRSPKSSFYKLGCGPANKDWSGCS